MRWPDEFRGAFMEASYARLWQVDELAAEAWYRCQYLAESELSDGRGGEPLHEAAQQAADLIYAAVPAFAPASAGAPPSEGETP